jgi:major membrane immunogen (membrane-anchored lipoprotein)
VYDDNGMDEFTVTLEDSDIVNLNYAYDRVIVQIKSASAGNATTYQIDAIGNKGGSS